LRIALVSREVYPLVGGGIGAFVAAAARLLSPVAEVTILTTSVFRPLYEQLVAEDDERLPPAAVRVAFVEEPTNDEADQWYDVVQCYGARVLDRLRELYPDGGPDVIEFPDYLGEAFVTLQAAHARDPFLDGSCVCVRLHTTREISMILNARYGHDFRSRTQFEMERYSLAHADRLIWAGGDVLGTYRRFYGADALAAATRIRHPYAGPLVSPGADSAYRGGSPLRLLYAGRLERRKGIHNLIAALTGLARDDFHLTLLGGDTDTGPLGVSMRELIRLAVADDPRIELRDEVDRLAVADVIRGHDLVVVPSLWECWPYAALEALRLNRPILATPVGGLVELVKPGISGWLSANPSREALEHAIERLLDRRDEVEGLVRGGGPADHARELTDEDEILTAYQQLAQTRPRHRRERRSSHSALPSVSAIVPYFRASRHVRETVTSLLEQTYPRIEIVLVNDGSFEDEDWVVAELAARSPIVVVSQTNSGLGAARNFGISQSRGRYVFPLDADNVADPRFVARAVEMLEHRHELAYVTSWLRYIEEDGTPRPGPQIGYQPLGNSSALVDQDNVAGDAAAVIPRRIFDLGFRYSEELTSFEDWHLYRELRQAGRFGAVIPERLIHYRLRADSMQTQFAQPRRARLRGEVQALLRENEVQWKSLSV
jgi:glycosyltransferase involved in cell wall biosynthesis